MHTAHRHIKMLVQLTSHIDRPHSKIINFNKSQPQNEHVRFTKMPAPNWPSKCITKITISHKFTCAYGITSYGDDGPIGLPYRSPKLQTYVFRQRPNTNTKCTDHRLSPPNRLSICTLKQISVWCSTCGVNVAKLNNLTKHCVLLQTLLGCVAKMLLYNDPLRSNIAGDMPSAKKCLGL